jgi:hypothetical protein
MKEVLITFGSIVAILFGVILIYSNGEGGGWFVFQYQVGIGFGVILLAAGITGLWMKERFRKD